MKTKILVPLILLCVTQLATAWDGVGSILEEKTQVAVYVMRGKEDGINKVIATRLLDELVRNNRRAVIDRHEAFVREIDNERKKQQAGAVDEALINRVAQKVGIKYVCLVSMSPAFGIYQIAVRVIDVETSKTVAMALVDSPLETMDDLKNVSAQIAEDLLGKRPSSPPVKEVVEKEPADRQVDGSGQVDGSLQPPEQPVRRNSRVRKTTQTKQTTQEQYGPHGAPVTPPPSRESTQPQQRQQYSDHGAPAAPSPKKEPDAPQIPLPPPMWVPMAGRGQEGDKFAIPPTMARQGQSDVVFLITRPRSLGIAAQMRLRVYINGTLQADIVNGDGVAVVTVPDGQHTLQLKWNNPDPNGLFFSWISKKSQTVNLNLNSQRIVFNVLLPVSMPFSGKPGLKFVEELQL
jgi:hypothetical protein